MTIADRFGRWIGRPGNCTKLNLACLAFALAIWWLTGEWSPLP